MNTDEKNAAEIHEAPPQDRESQAPATAEETAAPPPGDAAETKDGVNAQKNGYTPGQKALVAVLLLVIAGAIVFIGKNVYRNYIAPPPAFGAAGPSSCAVAAKIPKPVGNPDAPIKLEAAFGHCIASIMIPIHDAIAAYPDRIQGKFYALESLEGRDLVEEHGVNIAAIFINDKNKFTLKKADGTTREVAFQGPPGQGYTMADLVEVLRMKLAETEGGVPEDFDEKMANLQSATIGSGIQTCGPCADGSCAARGGNASPASGK